MGLEAKNGGRGAAIESDKAGKNVHENKQQSLRL